MFEDDERGVSDVVAFVLTFSIIILSIASVSVVGVDNLVEFRDREQVNSAERGMVALAATFDDIHRQGDQFRTTQLSLSGGNIQTVNDSELWLRVETTNSSLSNESWSYEVGSLQHKLDKPFGETLLSYEAGAVFGSSNAYPLHKPALRCTDDPSGSAIVSVVNLTGGVDYASTESNQFGVSADNIPSGSLVRSSGTSVRILADHDSQNSELVYSKTDTPATVYLNVSGMHSRETWNRHLGSNWEAVEASDVSWSGPDDDDYNYVWRCSAENVVVRVSTIQLSQP